MYNLHKYVQICDFKMVLFNYKTISICPKVHIYFNFINYIPTNYKFFGSHTKRCEQVGNAVPPALAYAVAKQCVVLLDKYYKNKRG